MSIAKPKVFKPKPTYFQHFVKKHKENRQQAPISERGRVIEFQLLDDRSFLITGAYTTFDEELKTILSKNFDGFFSDREKGWVLNKACYIELLKKLKALTNKLYLKEIPKFSFKALMPIGQRLEARLKDGTVSVTYPDSMRTKALEELPEHLRSKLYDFQKNGVEFGIKHCGRLLIADEMGVGKTVQALALAYIYKEYWPLLIVTPSSLRLTWKDEIKKWLKDVPKESIQLIDSSKTEVNEQALKNILTSYDMCIKFAEMFNSIPIQAIIADEVHYLKNLSTKRTTHLAPLLRNSKILTLLTGTPALAKPKELFTIVHLIRPDVFSNFYEFGARYCDPKPSMWRKGLDFEGASFIRELHFLLTTNFMIRRLKKDVLSQLPPKTRQKVQIPVDHKILNEINALLKTVGVKNIDSLIDDLLMRGYLTHIERNEMMDKAEKDNKSRLWETFSKCFALTGQAKVDGVAQYLNCLLENDCKFIVFAYHKEVLNSLEELMVAKSVGYVRIDGSVKESDRFERVKTFQEDPFTKVALLSLLATSVGITLTASSNVIFAEMYWTPAIMLQAEDRAHRIGQANNVNCHYLFGSGTLDEKLYKKLEEKIGVVSDIIDGDRINLEADHYNLGEIGPVSAVSPKKKRKSRCKADILAENAKKDSSIQKITNFFHQETLLLSPSVKRRLSPMQKLDFEEIPLSKSERKSTEKQQMFDRNVLKAIARNMNKDHAMEIEGEKEDQPIFEAGRASPMACEVQKSSPASEKVCADINLCKVCIVRNNKGGEAKTSPRIRDHGLCGETSVEKQIIGEKGKNLTSSVRNIKKAADDEFPFSRIIKEAMSTATSKQEKGKPSEETPQIIDLEKPVIRLVSDGNEGRSKKKPRHTAKPVPDENAKDWIDLFVDMEQSTENELSSVSREGRFKNSANLNKIRSSAEKPSLATEEKINKQPERKEMQRKIFTTPKETTTREVLTSPAEITATSKEIAATPKEVATTPKETGQTPKETTSTNLEGRASPKPKENKLGEIIRNSQSPKEMNPLHNEFEGGQKKVLKALEFKDSLWHIPGQKRLSDDIEEESVEEVSCERKEDQKENNTVQISKKTLFLSNIRPNKKLHQEDQPKKSVSLISREKTSSEGLLKDLSKPESAAKKVHAFKENNKHLFNIQPTEIISPSKKQGGGLLFMRNETRSNLNSLIIISDEE